MKFYAGILEILEAFPRETETRTLGDFLRFLLTNYVKEATGHFRDRNVSALMEEAVGPVDYTEVAQRMWRHRNFRRMKPHYQQLSERLLIIGEVLNIKKVTQTVARHPPSA